MCGGGYCVGVLFFSDFSDACGGGLLLGIRNVALLEIFVLLLEGIEFFFVHADSNDLILVEFSQFVDRCFLLSEFLLSDVHARFLLLEL